MKTIIKICAALILLLSLSGCDLICNMEALKDAITKLESDNSQLKNKVDELMTENQSLHEEIKKLKIQVNQKKSSMNKLFN